MRALPLALAGLLVACTSAPPPVAQEPTKVAVANPEPVREEPTPPEPLPTKEVELALSAGFVSMGLGSIQPKLWTNDELRQRLPAVAKREVQALERAQKAAREARRKESLASLELYRCEDCRERAQLQRKHAAAQRANEKSDEALDKAFAHAEKTLDRLLGAAKATPEIGIALARIEARSSQSSRGVTSRAVHYGVEGDTAPGIEALRRAAELAGPDREVGQQVRRELLHGLWTQDDKELARRLIGELAPTAPPEWRAELGFRAALFDALEGNDAEAAKGFEQALAAHVPGSSVSRKTLATAALVAHYRALDFDRALSAALRVFDEAARPEPPAPTPAPSAPPKPKPAVKKSKASSKRARSAALSQAAEFGMLGLLSTSSFGDPDLGEDGVARLAADSVERLGRDPLRLAGPDEARAAISSVLARRALYRNDLEGARRLAEAARALGPLANTRGALDVLQALAHRANEPDRARDLASERAKLPHSYRGRWPGPASEPDERDLVESLRRARGETAASDAEGDAPEPPVAHNVRSALRACVEPVRTGLPPATGSGKARRIATISLRARVFPDGRVELDADTDNEAGTLPKVLECLRRAAPRMLAHAPSSVSARVTLDESVRRANHGGLSGIFGAGIPAEGFGGLVGRSIGEAQGFGGLGVRGLGSGGGGTGEGIGLGSIGTRGRGSGYGSGAGRLGGKKQTPKGKKPSPPPAPK